MTAATTDHATALSMGVAALSVILLSPPICLTSSYCCSVKCAFTALAHLIDGLGAQRQLQQRADVRYY